MSLAFETVPHNEISTLIKRTIFGAFTFLSALAIRDTISKSIEVHVSQDVRNKLLFTYYYTVIVIAITVFIAWLWDSNGSM